MKLKAVLVDDELPILHNLKSVLPWERWDIELVALARNGVEALSAVREYNPDILLSDIRMPVMDGMELLAEVRKHSEDCEILMLTGYQEFEYARTALQYKVRDYILKPIDYDKLGDTVEKMAAAIRARRLAEQLTEEKLEELRRTVERVQPLDGRAGGAPHPAEEADDGTVMIRKRGERLIGKAGDYIRRNLSSDIGIEEVASHLGISCSYFSMLFKAHFGETFVEHVTRQRMERAMTLLLTSDKSITRIGMQVGYAERRYFTKVFQKYAHVTPSEYREAGRRRTEAE